jgi:hypothetical protein
MSTACRGAWAALLLLPLSACGGEENGGRPSGDDAGSGGESASGASGGVGATGGANGGRGGTKAGSGGSTTGGEANGGSGGSDTGSGGSGGNGTGGGVNTGGSSGGSAGSSGDAGDAGSAGSEPTGIEYDEMHRGGFCAEGWCWSTQLPAGAAITEMWGKGEGNVWATTRDGGVLRRVDGEWRRLRLSGRNTVGIWGSGPDDVYFSLDGAAYHVAAEQLERLDDPLFEGGVGRFTGTAPDDIWALTRDYIIHFDGEAWTRPSGLPVGANFREIHAGPDGRLWMVGISSGFEGVYLWDGVTFSNVVTERSHSAFVAAPDDVWVRSTSMLRGNDVDGFMPVAGGPSSGLKVFGTGSADVYSVDNGTLQHFDGEGWTTVSFGTVPGSYQYTGAATAPGEAFTGGQWGRIARLTPDEVTADLPIIPMDQRQDFTGVWSDGTRVYAVGPGLFELDRTGDTDVWRQLPGAGTNFFPQAIWGSSATDIWLGGTGDRVYHFDGEVVEEVDYGIDLVSEWSDIHGSGPDDVWFVGTRGIALHFDGEEWTSDPTASISDINDVWVAPDGNAWAVGRNGIVMRYRPDGGWEDVPEVTFSTVQWTAVTGTSSSDVWLGEYTNRTYHFDGTEWEAVEGANFSSGSIQKLFALAPDDVWGAGDFGSIVHYDGSSWQRPSAKLDVSWQSIWMSPSGEGWVVGEKGAIAHRLGDSER